MGRIALRLSLIILQREKCDAKTVDAHGMLGKDDNRAARRQETSAR